MQTIRNKEYGGERPLYASHNLRLENVTIHIGESSIKEASNIEAEDCRGVEVYNAMGQKVNASAGTEGLRCSIVTTPLPRGIYWVKIGQSGARKVFVY